MDDYQIAYECQRSIDLARLGYLFANGLLDADAANAIVRECQPLTGWFPLQTVSVDSVIDLAAYQWRNPADDIRPLAAAACRRVWNKWSSTGDITGAAEDWALELIAEYAKDDGVVLVDGERDTAGTCGQCAQPMFVENGVSHHGNPLDVHHAADADHAAILDPGAE